MNWPPGRSGTGAYITIAKATSWLTGELTLSPTWHRNKGVFIERLPLAEITTVGDGVRTTDEWAYSVKLGYGRRDISHVVETVGMCQLVDANIVRRCPIPCLCDKFLNKLAGDLEKGICQLSKNTQENGRTVSLEVENVLIIYSHRGKNQEKYGAMDSSDNSLSNVFSALRNQDLCRGLRSTPRLSRTQSTRNSEGI